MCLVRYQSERIVVDRSFAACEFDVPNKHLIQSSMGHGVCVCARVLGACVR